MFLVSTSMAISATHRLLSDVVARPGKTRHTPAVSPFNRSPSIAYAARMFPDCLPPRASLSSNLHLQQVRNTIANILHPTLTRLFFSLLVLTRPQWYPRRARNAHAEPGLPPSRISRALFKNSSAGFQSPYANVGRALARVSHPCSPATPCLLPSCPPDRPSHRRKHPHANTK